MKYFGVWVLVEGAGFLGGSSFCMNDELDSQAMVSKLMNIRPGLFEFSSGFRDIVNSFTSRPTPLERSTYSNAASSSRKSGSLHY